MDDGKMTAFVHTCGVVPKWACEACVESSAREVDAVGNDEASGGLFLTRNTPKGIGAGEPKRTRQPPSQNLMSVVGETLNP